MEQENKDMYFSEDFKEIANKAGKSGKAKFDEEYDLMKIIEKITLPDGRKKVIFTLGNKQLVYENGEFFIVSATDSTAPTKKLSRKEATEMYIEFSRRYGVPVRSVEQAREEGKEEKSRSRVYSKDEIKPDINNDIIR